MTTDLAGLYRAHVETLTAHAHETLEAEGFDALAIHSGRMVLKSSFDDQDWPFRPVPELEHWAKVDWPDVTLVVEAGKSAKLLVVRSDSFWERPEEPDWGLIRGGLEVEEAGSFDATVKALAGRKVAVVAHDDAVADALGGALNPSGVVDRIHDRRTRKTAYEIACMAEASRIAARGHLAAKEAFEGGERSELAIHLAYLAATGLDDPQTPYKNIVALNDAAAILHHINYRSVAERRSLLIDAGGVHRGYCSDITRTYAAEQNDFAELIGRMVALKDGVLEHIRVGMNYEELHDTSHRLMGSLLVDAGLFDGTAEAAVDTGVTRKLFPHGLGHSLGVQVHDVGMKKRPPRDDNPFLRNTSDIEAGQVFTIEPGLYFIDSLLNDLKESGASVKWDRIEALRPFGGIRVEDNIHVLENGIQNLTAEAGLS